MEETVKLARTAGGTCYGYVCDLCDKEDIYKKAELVKKEVGKVRIALWNEEREVIQILLQSSMPNIRVFRYNKCHYVNFAR